MSLNVQWTGRRRREAGDGGGCVYVMIARETNRTTIACHCHTRPQAKRSEWNLFSIDLLSPNPNPKCPPVSKEERFSIANINLFCYWGCQYCRFYKTCVLPHKMTTVVSGCRTVCSSIITQSLVPIKPPMMMHPKVIYKQTMNKWHKDSYHSPRGVLELSVDFIIIDPFPAMCTWEYCKLWL